MPSSSGLGSAGLTRGSTGELKVVSFIVFINTVALLYYSSSGDIDKSHIAYNTPVAIANTATNLSPSILPLVPMYAVADFNKSLSL